MKPLKKFEDSRRLGCMSYVQRFISTDNRRQKNWSKVGRSCKIGED